MSHSITAHHPATFALHCGWHHGDSLNCPPLDPELGDVLPELVELGAHIRITPAMPWLDPCSSCADNPAFPPHDAVATVVYTTSNRPNAFRYRETGCPLCLRYLVKWELDRGRRVTVEVPLSVGAVA